MEAHQVYNDDGSYKQYLADGSFYTVRPGEEPPSPRSDSRDSRSPSTSPEPAGRDANGQESRYAAWRRREDYDNDEGPPQDPVAAKAAREAAEKLQALASAQEKEKLDAAIEKQRKQQQREEQLMRAAFVGNPVRDKKEKKRKQAQLEEERLAALLKEVETEAATPAPRVENQPMFLSQAQIIAQQMAGQSMAAAVAARPSQSYVLPTLAAPATHCTMVGGPAPPVPAAVAAAALAAVPAGVAPQSVEGSVPSASSKDAGTASQPEQSSKDTAQSSADAVQDQAKETREDDGKKAAAEAARSSEFQILLPGEKRAPLPRERRYTDAPKPYREGLQFKNDREDEEAGLGQRRRGRSRDMQGVERRPRRRADEDAYDPEAGHRGRRRERDAGLEDRRGKRRYDDVDDPERRRSGRHRPRHEDPPDGEDDGLGAPAGKHRQRREGRARLDDGGALPSRRTRPNSASRSIQRPVRKAKGDDGTIVSASSSPSPAAEKPSKFSRGGFDKKEVPTDLAAIEAMRVAVATSKPSVIGSLAGATGVSSIGSVIGPDGKPIAVAPGQTPQQLPPGMAQFLTPGGQLPAGTFPGQFPNMFPARNNPFAGRQRPVFPGPMLRGDWTCPGCGDHVFAKNYCCRVCNTPRPSYCT